MTSHARKWYSLNWGVLVCACGAVAHEEIHGNLLAWHRKHKCQAANPVYPFDDPED